MIGNVCRRSFATVNSREARVDLFIDKLTMQTSTFCLIAGLITKATPPQGPFDLALFYPCHLMCITEYLIQHHQAENWFIWYCRKPCTHHSSKDTLPFVSIAREHFYHKVSNLNHNQWLTVPKALQYGKSSIYVEALRWTFFISNISLIAPPVLCVHFVFHYYAPRSNSPSVIQSRLSTITYPLLCVLQPFK